MGWHETRQAGLRQISQHPDRPWSIQIVFQRIEKGLLRPSREGVDRRHLMDIEFARHSQYTSVC